MSAYYPVVLTGASLIVCFWAEVFHLREIRWDRPRFLSKSFLGFVTFNIISYSLLIAELLLVWIGHEHRHFYTHIFNGCYAVLMFVVVIFFLIYGVEVFFKVSIELSR
jgi:von Hippel-Lindau disease tumor supressor